MTPIPIDSPDDPRLEVYRNVREADLVGRRGLFIAEGRLVVRTLLGAARFPCRSVLVTPVALEAIREAFETSKKNPEVLVASQEVMNHVVGFDIHRGCLAVGERPTVRVDDEWERVLPEGEDTARVVVLENLTNHDNVGGVFRSALALGASALLLSPACADPLYRKAIRVSMGAALRLPFAVVPRWPEGLEVLKRRGFTVAALSTGPGSVDLDDYAAAARAARLAIMVGTEGEGLSDSALAGADVRLRIAMTPGVDSLNAGVAAAIAMHRLFKVPPASSRG